MINGKRDVCNCLRDVRGRKTSADVWRKERSRTGRACFQRGARGDYLARVFFFLLKEENELGRRSGEVLVGLDPKPGCTNIARFILHGLTTTRVATPDRKAPLLVY